MSAVGKYDTTKIFILKFKNFLELYGFVILFVASYYSSFAFGVVYKNASFYVFYLLADTWDIFYNINLLNNLIVF